MPQVDFTPKSWEEKRAESLKHAMDMFGIVKSRNHNVRPDEDFDYLKRAEQYTHQANQLRERAKIRRAKNRNINLSRSNISGFTSPSDFDVVTHNIKGGGRNPGSIRRDLLKVLSGDPGIVGLQETGNRKRTKRVKNILRNQGYGVVGGSNTPLAFDKDQYRLKGKGSPVISPATRVGPAGAGPEVLKRKLANYAILKQLGGGPVRSVTNVHLAPSRQIAIRRRLSDMQIRNVIALQQRIAQMHPKAKRLVIGDLNVGKRSPLSGFERIGMNVQQSPFRTHRVGTPDWIIGDGVSGLDVMNTGSDHHALMANLRGGPEPRMSSGGGSFEAFVNAIAGKESGGDYGAVNRDSGALGKYQIMPANIPSWSQAALGRSISTQQFLNNPQLQEQIARAKLQEYFRKYGAAGAASAWYSGSPDNYNSHTSQGKYPSIHNYVQAILNAMGR